MSFTKHNNYEVPDGGVQNWDTSINENFELMELGQTIKATADVALEVGKVVYVNNGAVLNLAVSSSGSTISSQFIGFTTTAIASGIDGYVQINGNHKWPHWSFTPGPVYLDASTAGDVTQTEPTKATLVGYAIGTNELIIKPWMDTEFGTLSVDTINPLTADYVTITGGLTVGDLTIQGTLEGVDHGSIAGLADDDHTQYLGADMLRPATGLTISGTLWTDEISPESNPYVTVTAGLTIQASTFIRTGAEDLQTTLSLEQQDQDESFIEFTGLAVTGGTSSLDLSTGEIGAVYGKAQVKVNGVTKWIRLYDDET